MKKIIGSLLILIMLSGMSFLGYKSYTLLSRKKEAKERLKVLPSLNLLALDSTALELNNSRNTLVLVYYNSACDLCEYEIEQFKKNNDLLSNEDIVLISTEPLQSIKDFGIRHGALDLFTFAHINGDDVIKSFGTEALPHVMIYQESRLVKEFMGATPFESILEALKHH